MDIVRPVSFSPLLLLLIRPLTWTPGDPWREATTSATLSPTSSTPSQPIAISDGFHCSDLITANAKVDGTVLGVQTQALAAMAGWLEGFEPSHGKKRASVRLARET